jgi:hypothetical protein
MPVQQVLPNVQDQSGEIWGNAIANISLVLGQGATQYAQDYEASKKLAGHNDRVYAQAVDTLSDIKKRNNISDDQYAKLLKQVTPAGDESDYEKRMGNVFSTLVYWDRSGAAQKGVGVPDLNVAPDVNVSLINQQLANAKEGAINQKLLGPAQPPTPEPAPMGPPGPQTLKSLTAMSQIPSVLTETAGQDLTKPNTTNLDPSMASLVNSGDWHPPMAAPSQPVAPNTLAASVSISPEIDSMISHIPTQEGKAEATSIAQQYKQGLIPYTDFLKEYNATLKESAKTVTEINKAKQQQIDDAAKQKITEDAANLRNTNTVNGSIQVARIGAEGRKSNGGGGANIYNLTPEENAALNDALVNGLDPYQINSRTARIYAQQELINPGRKWNELGAQAKFERGTGTMASKALINSVTPLFDNLLSAGKELGNSNIQFVNKVINFLKEGAGNSDITQFNNQRDDIVAEVERGLLGTGVLSDTKYIRAIKNINSAQSYPQLEAAVRATKLVLNARLHALKQGPNPDAAKKVGESGSASSAGSGPLQIGRFQVQVH